jgi:hypothetical protein
MFGGSINEVNYRKFDFQHLVDQFDYMNFDTGRCQLTIPTKEDVSRKIMHWERLEHFKVGDLMVHPLIIFSYR